MHSTNFKEDSLLIITNKQIVLSHPVKHLSGPGRKEGRKEEQRERERERRDHPKHGVYTPALAHSGFRSDSVLEERYGYHDIDSPHNMLIISAVVLGAFYFFGLQRFLTRAARARSGTEDAKKMQAAITGDFRDGYRRYKFSDSFRGLPILPQLFELQRSTCDRPLTTDQTNR